MKAGVLRQNFPFAIVFFLMCRQAVTDEEYPAAVGS
jgi:hypothetical protein